MKEEDDFWKLNQSSSHDPSQECAPDDLKELARRTEANLYRQLSTTLRHEDLLSLQSYIQMESYRLGLDGSDSYLAPPAIKVRPLSQDSELESDFAVSPHTPLLSTAVEENCFACGRNNVGQLGMGAQGDVLEIQPVQFAHHWAMVSFGDHHACGISCDGELYSWGLSNKGQLGHEDEDSRELPEHVANLKSEKVKYVSCGGEHTVAVTETQVYSWGSNEQGQLGQEDSSIGRLTVPKSISVLQDKMVAQVVCGKAHTLAVTAQSHVYAWGANNYGQLGLGDKADQTIPRLIEALWALPVRQLAAGDHHSCVLTRSGFLFTWGLNKQGQLGQTANAEHAAAQTTGRSASSRRRMAKKVNQRYLSTLTEMGISYERAEQALIETKNGGVELAAEWIFDNYTGRTGTMVPSASTTTTTGMSGGEGGGGSHHNGSNSASGNGVLSLEKKGLEDEAYSSRENKTVDDVSTRTVVAPRRVPLKAVQFIAAGGNHTVAICQNSVFGWGAGEHGQLGLGDYNTKDLPTKITALEHKKVIQAACGTNHTLFLTKDGQILGAGANDCGQLGQVENLITEATCFAEPMELKLPFLSINQHRGVQRKQQSMVVQISAGDGTSSFLTSSPDEVPTLNTVSLWDKLETSIQSLEDCDSDQTAECTLRARRLAGAIEMVFGSAAALNVTFGFEDRVGIDFHKLHSMQKRFLSQCSASYLENHCHEQMRTVDDVCSMAITEAMSKAFVLLIADLSSHLKLLYTPERAQLLLAAAQHPLLSQQGFAKSMLPRLCVTILNAPSNTRLMLIKGWAEYPPELLEEAVIAPLQSYVTKELMATKKLTVTVMNAIKVLGKVEEANEKGQKLPPEAFYNQLISEKMDVLDHYIAWRQSRDQPPKRSGQDGPFSFCSYPFLLDARAKSRLLHTEAKLQMEQTVAHSRLENVYGPFKKSRRELDEARVLPNRKSALKKEEQEVKKKRSNNGEGGRSRSRRGESASFRSLVYHIFRPGHGDHRAAVADEDSEAGTSEKSDNALARAGSLQLPKPEDCEIAGTSLDMCILRVRRNHLIEDALNEISRQLKKDLFKPLRVHFIGEDGIDGGGVKKEFFQLLVQDLLSPDYGMLACQPESRTYWFNPTLMLQDENYEDEMFLIGLVIGLAVYNGVLLDLPLPMAFYKKLIHQDVTLQDLEDMQPSVGRSLRQLLQYEGPDPVEDVFFQTMSIDVDVFGKVKRVPLTPNGDEILVTDENRSQFVKHYVDYALGSSIQAPFEAFAKGLRTICGGPAIQLFNAKELERLVCGNPNLDFEALERNARYEGGFSKTSMTVRWLWEIVSEFSIENKKLFLKFFTGSDRAPIGGLGNLKCVIQQNGSDNRKLPTAHTCFNTLLLPNYSTKEDLLQRLKLAIMNSEGFGLE